MQFYNGIQFVKTEHDFILNITYREIDEFQTAFKLTAYNLLVILYTTISNKTQEFRSIQ